MQRPTRSHVLVEYANGVMDARGKFYPYLVKQMTSGGATTTIAAKPGTRLYIYKTVVMVRLVAADTTTYLQSYGTLRGVTHGLGMVMTVPQVASAQIYEFYPHLLLDLATAVVIDQGTAVPTDGRVAVTYAEVEEVSGEYTQ